LTALDPTGATANNINLWSVLTDTNEHVHAYARHVVPGGMSTSLKFLQVLPTSWW
jgi:hypothetical protein